MTRAAAALLALVAVSCAATATPAPSPSPTPKTVADIPYATVNGKTLLLDLDLPVGPGPFPVIVWIHGGAWAEGDKAGGPAAFYATLGYAVARVNYRLSGEAVFPAQLFDVKGAVRWLRANAGKYALDPDRIDAWGASAGAHLAALLGTTGGVADLEGDIGGNLDRSSRVSAVIDWYGPTDFLRMDEQMVCVPPRRVKADSPRSGESLLVGCQISTCPEKAKRANPIVHVTQDDAPFLIVHGMHDCTVPHGQSQLLYDALKAAGVDATLRLVPNADHGSPEIFAPDILAAVDAFLARTLKI
ncbi:MAG: alpha/beta hydrolase [Chloroflexota bacterium]